LSAVRRNEDDVAISVRGLRVGFGGSAVLDGVDFTVARGEIMGLVGASGAGKTVLLRALLGHVVPDQGEVRVLGVDPARAESSQLDRLHRHWGVAFQHGALFSSLTVAQNVEVPLRTLDFPPELMDELAPLRIHMVGLPPEVGLRHPRELSGGMRKRAALARALALGPELLLLDEPTSGLDPIGATAIDDLIGSLAHALDLTVLMITHDVESLYAVCDRVAVLVDGHIEAVGTLDDVAAKPHPWIRKYFHGPRGRAAERGRTSGEAGKDAARRLRWKPEPHT
jgi:phospholipid/cholesterol/gamma-HCH transport system ATP-binding protein